MNEPVKSNLPAENKSMHMVRRYRSGKECRPLQLHRSFSCVGMLTMHEPTYPLRINECTWSGGTTSGKESRPL